MARGAGQSFLQAGAHRLSSHRLSRLYQKWAALGRSSTSCACTCTMQGKHASPNGARRAVLSWDEFLLNSAQGSAEWWHLASSLDVYTTRRSRQGSSKPRGGCPAFPPGRPSASVQGKGQAAAGAGAGP